MRLRLPVVIDSRLRPWADTPSLEVARFGSVHVRLTESLLSDSCFPLEPIGFRASTGNATVGSPIHIPKKGRWTAVHLPFFYASLSLQLF